MDPIQAIKESQPPVTDPISWLVIVEINLSAELLPAFNEILLKDTDLTGTVGWDLIPLLLNFAESRDCLRTIGRFGNPRECIIKVCEQLRFLKFEADDDSSVGSNAEEDVKDPDSAGIRELHISDPPEDSGDRALAEADKLISLIRLLAALHPRIKTKYPSRFLSTSLSALLATFSDAIRFVPAQDITLEIIRFVKTLSGVKRPHLPQRYSSQQIVVDANDEAAGDPEATNEQPAPEEQALTTRLLSSFVTHVLEDFINSAPEPGIGWSSRFYETFNNSKIVPGSSVLKRFAEEVALQERDSIAGQLVALARDLNLDDDELLNTLTKPVVQVDRVDDGPPSSPSDIPLSEAGSLFLLTSRIASSILFGSSTSIPPLFVFPDHASISFKFIGQAEAGGSSSIGTEPEAVIDAVLAIGHYLVNSGKIGDLIYEGDEKFNQYLQSLSLLSANCPNAALRYQAHLLVSRVLHSHPQDILRLGFIRDTLENCPFENLKGSAVEWIKTETLSADSADTASTDEPSIFATPVALDILAPFLFPDLSILKDASTDEELSAQWLNFKANFSFYVAALNFYYLLIRSTSLQESIDVKTVLETHKVRENFVEGLTLAVETFNKGLEGPLGKEEGEDAVKHAHLDLFVLEETLSRVKDAK